MKRFLCILLSFVLLFPLALSTAAVEEEPIYYLPGDVNNDEVVNAGDARDILRLSVGLETWETIAAKCNDVENYNYKKACDPDGDGKFSAGDARLTLRASVGIEIIPALKQTLRVGIGSEPLTMDPVLNSEVGAFTLLTHLFAGLAKYEIDENGALQVVADCAKELPVGTVGADGKVTYVFELKDNLKWSDGTPLTAADFVYSWNRAADPDTFADYGYLLDIIDGYYDMYDNPNAKLNVHADGNKLTVVTTSEVPYFYDLLTMGVCMPVKQSVVESNSYWAGNANTYVSNGAYTMIVWEHDKLMTLVKNENYHDAARVKMHTIEFNLTDDAEALTALYCAGELDFLDSYAWVTSEDISAEELYTIGSMGTYYYNFNVNKSLLPSTNTLTGAEKEKAEAEVRNALSLLVERSYILQNVVGMPTENAASSFVASGILDADGKAEFYENAGSSDSFNGYFDPSAQAYEANCIAALTTLAKYYNYNYSTGKFTNFPTITLSFNEGTGHADIAQCVQYDLGLYGIPVTLHEYEWSTFLNTRKEGMYTLARNGWIADFNDPVNFLDMWTTDSGNNDAQLGKGAHASLKAYSLDLTPYGINYKVASGTWAQTYDYLISVIKKISDTELRYKLMHLAEDLLMSTGAIMPLYYYTDSFVCDSSVKDWYATPYGIKYFMYSTIR